jgi:hypothetical protein
MSNGPSILVDEEFAALIPPIAADELKLLESDIAERGCLSPLVGWRVPRKLLDGHNRLRICQRLGISYRVRWIDLPDRDTAMMWIINHQLGRRNLQAWQRAELVLRLEPMIKAAAKARQVRAGNTKKCVPGDPIGRFEIMGKRAGIGRMNMWKASQLKAKAPAGVIEALRKGDVTITGAFRQMRHMPAAPVGPITTQDLWSEIRRLRSALRAIVDVEIDVGVSMAQAIDHLQSLAAAALEGGPPMAPDADESDKEIA